MWVLKMALRDSRRNKSRLFLFISSIVLGIAAMVAISSFSDNLKKDIDRQAGELIGADLVIDTRKALADSTQQLVDSLKGLSSDNAEEQNFVSMVLFEKNGGSRLVQIRGISGNYPFYGQLETLPAAAANTFQVDNKVLVDQTLMLQFGAKPGDSVRIGNSSYAIAGTLLRSPGRSGISGAVAPAVLVPLPSLAQTGLLQKGSRVNYIFYFQFPENIDSDQLAEKLDDRLEKEGLDAETIQMRKESTGRAFNDLTGFLSLVGFVALLLGCIGVSSAVQIYIREKISSIAILRCLGVSSNQAFLIYLVQIIGIGFIGSLLGAALGVLIQQALPTILADLLPVQVSNDLSWAAILKGIALGVFISILFALIPLIKIRNVSPLNTLQISFEDSDSSAYKQTGFIYLFIILFIGGFARTQLDSWLQTLAFTAGVVLGFLILYGISLALISLIKRYFPHSWNYLWRQGLSNLYRPNNQTVILVMAIGLGTTFIAILFFVKSILLAQISFSTDGTQPNMVLFDVQTAQKEQVADFVKDAGMPVLQEVPIVTVQVESIKGYRLPDVLKDSTLSVSRRAFSREIRVTFRDSLIDSERITDGKWVGEIQNGEVPLVSLERDYAERIGVKIGDEIVYNVQGLLIPTRVGSLREVDWNRVQTNFRLVFPKGVIDQAPQFHVLMTRAASKQESADFQLALVQQIPNISIFDLSLVLTVLDEIFNKISFVIQFMAGLSIITGIIVLIASVLISKFQRIQESVLLRTLGASRRQIIAITALEYLFLGALSSVTGIGIALISSWALATFSFEVDFQVDYLVIIVLFVAVTALTVFIGVLNLRSILRKPPLEVLRK